MTHLVENFFQNTFPQQKNQEKALLWKKVAENLLFIRVKASFSHKQTNFSAKKSRFCFPWAFLKLKETRRSFGKPNLRKNRFFSSAGKLIFSEMNKILFYPTTHGVFGKKILRVQ